MRKPALLRNAQAKAKEGWRTLSDNGDRIWANAKGKLKSFDDQHEVTKMVDETASTIKCSLTNLDDEIGVTDKARVSADALVDTARAAGAWVDLVGESSGVFEGAREVSQAASKAYRRYGLDALSKSVGKGIDAAGRAIEVSYGNVRGAIKPYFLPDTPDELFRITKDELNYISACIMQISPGEAEKLATQFGTLVASKIAGVAATGALLSLVGTFGTAGTGTAIATLSGAAATSAKLAWVGGLLGGGMATGVALTGGIALVVGLGAYKALGSKRRDFESLDEVEQRIVQYCLMLIAILDDHLAQKHVKFDVEQADALLTQTLLPLKQMLEDEADRICTNLDAKNAAAYRQHVLRDFQPAILEPFQQLIEGAKANKLRLEFAIGGVFYALLTRTAIEDTPENQLVLQALRRSDPDLIDATESELGDYLSAYNDVQLKGLASNVKGIYHELRWVERHNETHSDTYAEIAPTINQAGYDILIRDKATGEVIEVKQLKATNDVSAVYEHRDRHGDVDILVTEELASRAEVADSTGFTNDELTRETNEVIDAVAGNTLADRALEGAGLGATAATGQELLQMLQGRREFPEAAKQIAQKMTAASAATAITAYLFS